MESRVTQNAAERKILGHGARVLELGHDTGRQSREAHRRGCVAASDEPAASAELMPAVPIKRSVTVDHLVCLRTARS
jgi:predicted transcriptional regulator